jgi:DNA-binding transcriptional ArsR family regulator
MACAAIRGEILKEMLQHQPRPAQPPLDAVFQALADPARRSMLERLTIGPASVSQLAEPLPMSLAAVGQHIAVLEAAGLVTSQKVGRVRTCTLDTTVLTQAEKWINARRIAVEQQLDRLGEYLAATKPADEV